MVRLMRLYDAEGWFGPAAVPTHLIRKSGLGLLGGLELQDMLLPELRAQEDWKFMFATIDNAASNVACSKNLIGGLAVFPNLISVLCPSLSHLESNAVSNGSIPSGYFLRSVPLFY